MKDYAASGSAENFADDVLGANQTSQFQYQP
jgi:hypothetical protein